MVELESKAQLPGGLDGQDTTESRNGRPVSYGNSFEPIAPGNILLGHHDS
jgi:hypothetical protein